MLLRLPKNEHGRDFVCGDIHGSYTCVERFLKEVNFDKTKDRLICAGDLVDRGPENEKCLEFLFEDWFFACLGNHEHMMHSYFTHGPYGAFWGSNGGNWGTKYRMWATSWETAGSIDPAARTALGEFIRKKCVTKLAELPFLITVEKKSGGIFHVLHAELPIKAIDGPITDEDLADEDRIKDLAAHGDHNGQVMIWGRFMFYPMYREQHDSHNIKKWRRYAEHNKIDKFFTPALSHIYSGHTIVQKPLQFFGQTNLDTMAYASYGVPGGYGYASKPGPQWAGLTVTEPETGKFWLVNDHKFEEVQPTIIS